MNAGFILFALVLLALLAIGQSPQRRETLVCLTGSFFRDFANSQVGHEQPIIRPRVSEQIDFEGELAVVIGRTSRYISESQTR